MPGPSITVPAGLSLNEARRFCKKFAVTMAQQQEVDVWWHPVEREVVVRSAVGSVKALPPAVIPVGRYRAPYPARLFLEDLGATVQQGVA
jgi:hypothetical protein